MKIEIELKDVTTDGYPDAEAQMTAFLFDGCVVSGWPAEKRFEWQETTWEADSDVGHHRMFVGVRYWFSMPDAMWQASLSQS